MDEKKQTFEGGTPQRAAVLRNLGVCTVHDLAVTGLDDLLPRYLPEVTHRDNTEDRLRLAARRAKLLHGGVELERIDDSPIVLRTPAVEIDFDIGSGHLDRLAVDEGQGGACGNHRCPLHRSAQT